MPEARHYKTIYTKHCTQQLTEYLAVGNSSATKPPFLTFEKDNVSTSAPSDHSTGRTSRTRKSSRLSRARSRLASSESCGLPMPASNASAEVDAREPVRGEVSTDAPVMLSHQQLFAAPASAARSWPTAAPATVPEAQHFGSPGYNPSPRAASVQACYGQGWQRTETISTTEFQPLEQAASGVQLTQSFPLMPLAAGIQMAAWIPDVDPAEQTDWDSLINGKTPRGLAQSEGSPIAMAQHADMDASWDGPEEDMVDDFGPDSNALSRAWSPVPMHALQVSPFGGSFMI